MTRRNIIAVSVAIFAMISTIVFSETITRMNNRFIEFVDTTTNNVLLRFNTTTALFDGNVTLGDAAGDTITINGTVAGAPPFTAITVASYIDYGTAGVRVGHDGDGAIMFLGLGNGSDEDLWMNLDDTSNTGVFTSTTGLVTLNFSGIALQESGIAVLNNDEIDASAELAAIMDDETGSGLLVFATSPVFTTQITTPQIVTADNGATFINNIPVTGVDAGAHTWSAQIDGNIGVSVAATGDGAGGVGARTILIGQSAAADIVTIGDANADFSWTDAQHSMTALGVLDAVDIANTTIGAGGASSGAFTTVDASTDFTAATGGGTDAVFTEEGIDRASAGAETFNFQNSGAGTMRLQEDGVDVVTGTDVSDSAADTEILIGGAAGVATWNLMSGDIAITNGGVTAVQANAVALTTDTTGNYAAGDAEAGAALTGDSATGFFGVGQIEAARGGTGDDTSATTGLPRIDAGNWTYAELSGDVTTAGSNATVVGNDTHDHTGATISGLDISSDTNLAVTAPVTLTDDTLSLATYPVPLTFVRAGGDFSDAGQILHRWHTLPGAKTALRMSVSFEIPPSFVAADGIGSTNDSVTVDCFVKEPSGAAGSLFSVSPAWPAADRPTMVAVTADTGGTYTQYTAQATDNNAATDVPISSLDTLANGDWLLVGYSRPLGGVGIAMDAADKNGNVSVMTMQYWDGAAWSTATDWTDGTAAGGATFGQSGVLGLVLAIGEDEDATTQIIAAIDGTARYYYRFSVSAALDASTNINEVYGLRLNGAEYDYTADQNTGISATDTIQLQVTEADGGASDLNATIWITH